MLTKQKTYVVGAQNISYYPHYDFRTDKNRGYAWALLEEFAASEGIQFVYIALPIKRLQVALKKDVVDFAYPDNPKWTSQENNSAVQKHFSQPLAIAMGSTIVKTENLGHRLDQFTSLAVPFGFTPVKWLNRIERNKVKLVQVKDADAALELVMLGRVSGADVEYHVANYQLQQSSILTGLTMDPGLPYDVVGFRLSSYRHPELLQKLDSFIKRSESKLNELKKRYNLKATDEIIAGFAP